MSERDPFSTMDKRQSKDCSDLLAAVVVRLFQKRPLDPRNFLALKGGWLQHPPSVSLSILRMGFDGVPMNKNIIIILSVLCAILAILCICLAFALYQKPRFLPTNGGNPFLMFDEKTKQACWSGPQNVKDPFDEWRGYVVQDEHNTLNTANVPFCKNLK